MKFIFTIAALAVGSVSAVANAAPVKLSKTQLDRVVAGVPSVNQQATSPGTFPGGNPARANGQANNPSGK